MIRFALDTAPEFVDNTVHSKWQRRGHIQMKQFICCSLAGALTVGASVIPTLLFSGLVYRHTGEYAYLLPAVLLFAMEKSCIFLVQGFGGIRNPMKLLLWSLLLAIVGTAIALLGNFNASLWSVGAALLGCGMAVYAPLFRTIRDDMRRKGTWESKAAIPGGYLFLVVLIGAVFGLRYDLFSIVLGIYLVLLVIVFFFLSAKQRTLPSKNEPMFDANSWAPHAAVYTVVTMAATLVVCFYKQTADVRFAFGILAAYTVLLAAMAMLHPEPYRDYSVRTLWYGAMRSFLTAFSLIYFAATGQDALLFLVYVMFGLGIGLSKLIARPMKKMVGEDRYEMACMILALLSSCLLLTFRAVPYLAGVLLGCLFASAGNSFAARIYLDDDAYPFNERHLVRTKFFATGAVMSQGMLLLVLLAVSAIFHFHGSETLASFLYGQGNPDYAPVFAWTLAVSLVGLGVGAAVPCSVFRK